MSWVKVCAMSAMIVIPVLAAIGGATWLLHGEITLAKTYALDAYGAANGAAYEAGQARADTQILKKRIETIDGTVSSLHRKAYNH